METFVPPRSDGFPNNIQSQLAQLLHGQERMENMISKFASRPSSISSTVVANVSNGIGPENVFPSTPKMGAVQLCQVASANGDSSSTPRFVHPLDENHSEEGGKRPSSSLGLGVGILDFPTTMKLGRISRVSHCDLDEQIISQQVEASFKEARSKAERQKQRLKNTLKDNRECKLKEDMRERRLLKIKSPLRRLLQADSRKKEVIFDAVMQAAIILNTIFIGISVDLKHKNEWNIWLVTDMCFGTLFTCELFVKLYLHGKDHFFGSDRISNLFDFIIISIDIFQLIGTLRELGASESNVRSASVLRVARLIRIVRIIRIFKFKGMRAFVDMLQGVLDGAATLFWAILMFLLTVYCGGILCKICFGTASNDEEKNTTLYPLFQSVWRSMLTVFRCSFGDCSTIGGTPIPEYILDEYGSEYALGYCLFLFFITVGLFNIISAIFVDTTMNASAAVLARDRNERMKSKKLWAMNISAILSELLQFRNDLKNDTDAESVDSHNEWRSRSVDITPDTMLEKFDSLVKVEFTRKEVEDVIHYNPKVQQALDSLDIEPADHKRLSDILDPDHSGTIDAIELVEGLGRLRGDPRRSDVVTCDLMIRSLQAKMDEVLAEVLYVKRKVTVLERLGIAADNARRR